MIFLRLMFIMAGLLISTDGALAESQLCTDLASYSCSPGTIEDGTGSQLGHEDFRTRLLRAELEIRNFSNGRIERFLNREENAYFMTVARNGLGLKGSPMCEDINSEQCREAIRDGLSNIAVRTNLRSVLPDDNSSRQYNMEGLAYIMQNRQFQQVMGDIATYSRSRVVNQNFVNTLDTQVVPQLKNSMVAELRTMGIEESALELMINKINSISFDGTNCSSDWEMDDLFLTNANYNPMSNSVGYCSGFLLRNNSHFTAAMVIGHELAHSIDPCNLGRGPAAQGVVDYPETPDQSRLDQAYPIPNVLSCLRRPDSVGASNNQNRVRTVFSTEGGVAFPRPPGGKPSEAPRRINGSSGEMEASDEASYDGNSGSSNVNFCYMGEQIGESFCDWMSARVLSGYIRSNFPDLTPAQILNGYSNAFRPICEAEGAANFEESPHPPGRDRINSILLQDPDIRAHMGCTSSHPDKRFCDPNVRPSVPGTSGDSPPPWWLSTPSERRTPEQPRIQERGGTQ